MMTPISALRRQAESNPEGTAFIFADEIWTYARLAVEADRCARAMRARGVRPGDRVAFHMANLPELVVAYYACFRLGAVAAPLNARFKAAEIEPLLARLRPVLYLGQAQLYPQVAEIGREILPLEARYVIGDTDQPARPWAELFDGADAVTLPDAPDPDGLAFLLTTSGTTGVPKFVAYTPRRMGAAIEACRRIGFEVEQVVVNSLPMMHGAGVITMLCCVRFGHPMILLERFEADAVLEAIEIYQCSWMLGLPFMFAELARAQRMRPRQVMSLRLCLSCGDACPVQLQEEFAALFGADLLALWGSTEIIGSLIHGLRIGPVSRLAPDAQFRLVDEDGAPVAAGEIGELLVRGPNMSAGYWKGPGAIDPLAPDGWYHTGDLMRRGEDDEIWFVARKKDLIVRGGSNISPIEVERVLMAHPAVQDAAVVGIPDPVLGQRVAGVVRLKGRPTRGILDDILGRARSLLADYKVPERLTMVGDIPRNAMGKVDRKGLVTMLSAEARAEAVAAPL